MRIRTLIAIVTLGALFLGVMRLAAAQTAHYYDDHGNSWNVTRQPDSPSGPTYHIERESYGQQPRRYFNPNRHDRYQNNSEWCRPPYCRIDPKSGLGRM